MAMTRRELFLALGSVTIGSAVLRTSAQQPNAAAQSLDWRLHNLDLAGTRFSPATQINTSNVKSLAPRWLFQHGVIDGVSNQTTPIIVDGMMVVTDSRGSVYAVDAADGHLLWTYDVTACLEAEVRMAMSSETVASVMQTASSMPQVAHFCLPSMRKQENRLKPSERRARRA